MAPKQFRAARRASSPLLLELQEMNYHFRAALLLVCEENCDLRRDLVRERAVRVEVDRLLKAATSRHEDPVRSVRRRD
jgi:hypothetical protein